VTIAGMPVRPRLVLALLLLSAVIVATGVVIGRHLGHRSSAPEATPGPTQTAVISPAPPTVSSPPNSAPNELAPLAADFARLANQLRADIGVAASAEGSTQSPSTLGNWQPGPAWSTIKVPLTIAALRQQDPPPATTDAMRAAITESDNAAAESIWQGLGDPVSAAHKVEAVLREAGDFTTVQSQKVRPEFTAFGQTDWSLTDQARFLAFAACDNRNKLIFALMGQVEPDQRWGIGTVAGTRFKGGWGPSISGSYLVRQIGLLSGPNGTTAVAIAAQPASGSFADGTRDLTAISDWLSAHMTSLPAGHCEG
jgi:hypothetical protein